ncbi:tetratricopeptide repeat-containing sulfotransferase family protein [Thalassotalea sp. HSM 43]|uniref:tetratricopeptide repeat-containing sulfotransferase family protein n=1 Tax=Thalassotalea sp. HSM 43 TaxID=2552945 RepID=UPI0016746B58|nr:sulfotransferase [Thalassotalea sp. HSM 43]
MKQAIRSLLEKGFALQQQGDLAKAKSIYNEILSTEHDNQFALNLLAVIAIAEHQHEQAVKLLEKALTVNNRDPESYANLGLAYKALKQLEQAKQAFEASLQLNPNQTIVLNNLGNVQASLNQHKKAIYCFESALRLDNSYTDCMVNLCNSLKACGDIDKALQVVNYAKKLNPSRADLHTLEGELLNSLGHYESAVERFQQAIHFGDRIVAKLHISTALKQLNKTDLAKQMLEQVIAVEPHNEEAHNHLGVLLEQMGEFDLAAQHFRIAIKHNPTHASSYYQLSKLKNSRLESTEIEQIKQLLADQAQPDIFRCSLHLALACEYEKHKQYDAAIEHVIKGKGYKARQYPYQADKTKQHLQLAQSHFPVNKTAQQGGAMTPIFIVGMPRSGTTLTEQILSSHSKIVGAGELGFINDVAKEAVRLTNKPYPQCTALLSEKHWTQLRDMYLNLVQQRIGNVEYFVDKNPLNFNMVGFIQALFPASKIIYCQRDPMDNCMSIFKLPFDDNQTYAHELSALGDYYNSQQNLMTFWQGLYPDAILPLAYENVVDDLAKEARQLFSFLHIEFESEVLDFHKNTRTVLTPSAEQVRQPIYKSSVNSWQRYGDAVTPLLSALRQ